MNYDVEVRETEGMRRETREKEERDKRERGEKQERKRREELNLLCRFPPTHSLSLSFHVIYSLLSLSPSSDLYTTIGHVFHSRVTVEI